MDAALILADVVERFSVRRWRSSLLRGFPLRLWRKGLVGLRAGAADAGRFGFCIMGTICRNSDIPGKFYQKAW